MTEAEANYKRPLSEFVEAEDSRRLGVPVFGERNIEITWKFKPSGKQIPGSDSYYVSTDAAMVTFLFYDEEGQLTGRDLVVVFNGKYLWWRVRWDGAEQPLSDSPFPDYNNGNHLLTDLNSIVKDSPPNPYVVKIHLVNDVLDLTFNEEYIGQIQSSELKNAKSVIIGVNDGINPTLHFSENTVEVTTPAMAYGFLGAAGGMWLVSSIATYMSTR